VDALQESHLLRALSDNDPLLREHGVLLVERLPQNGIVSDTLWSQLSSLAGDPSIRVRYQLAFTLGALQRADRLAVLRQILSRDLVDPWMRHAVLSSLEDKAGLMFVSLAADSRFRNDVVGLAFLRQLATLIGAQGHADDVAQAINFLTRDQTSVPQAYALLAALGEGLHRTKSSLALVDPQAKLQPWYTSGFNAALDAITADPVKVEALRLLQFSPYRFSDIGDWLLLLCFPSPNTTVQAAAIDALGRFDEPVVLQGLLDRWQGLSPPVRNHALTVLLSKERRVPAVLDALAARRIPLMDFSPWQLNFLRTYRDPALSARAIQLLGPVPVRRPDVEAQYRPALRLQGSVERGRPIFGARCAQCHRFGNEGQEFGPDLTGARTRGRENLLMAVLEPNLEVKPQYATWIVDTKEGEFLIGTKADDDLPTITLRQPGGVQLVWPRLNVRSAENPSWSLMPDNLEQGLAVQDLADLMEFLMAGTR
jgi:putative heme-binding domain-containing protein